MTISVVQTGNAAIGPGYQGNTAAAAFTDTVENNFVTALNTNAAKVWIKGAGAGGADYQGTVNGFTSSSHISVTPATSTSVTAKPYGVGTAVHAWDGATKVTITFPSNTAAGNLLVIGVNADPALTISTVNDPGNGNWTPCAAGITNGIDYFQRVYAVTSAVGGACTVTVTFSGTPTGSFAVFIIEANTTIGHWVIDQTATGNSTSTTVATGNFTTKFPNEIIIGVTGVDSNLSGGATGYTAEPSYIMTAAGSGVGQDYAGDNLAYKIVTTIQSAVNFSETQVTNATFLVTAVTFAAVAYLPPDEYVPRRQPRAAIAEDYPIDDRQAAAPTINDIASWVGVDVDPRGKGRAPVAEDYPIDDRTVITTNIGYVPSDVDPRGKGRAPVAEEYPIDDRSVILAKLGYVPSDVDPRGKGRQPVAEDYPIDDRTVILAKLGYVPSDVDPRGKSGRQPVSVEEGTTQAIPFTDIASFAFEDSYIRGKGRFPWPEDAPIDPRQASAQINDIASWAPVEVDPRGKGRAPWPEDALTQARQTGISESVGWISVDVEPRGKGRAPWPEDVLIQARQTGISESVGWVSVDVDPRGKGRYPWPEESLLEARQTGISESVGWVPVDVDPRGKGRAPWPEDVLLQARQTGISESVGWVPVEVEPRGKGRYPWPEDSPIDPTKPLLTLGWLPVDVEPRGKGRAPWPEDVTLETFINASLDNIAGWFPVDVDPRGKGRAPWPEDVPLEGRQTGISESVGWVEVDVAPRGKGRFPWPEEPLLKPGVLGVSETVGWMPVDVEPRGKGRAPWPEDVPLEPRISSLGWFEVEVFKRGYGRAPWPEDPPIEQFFTITLPTIGWVPVEVDPRGKGRAPWPEDPVIESRIIANLSGVGWVEIEAPRRSRAPAPWPEDVVISPPILRPAPVLTNPLLLLGGSDVVDRMSPMTYTLYSSGILWELGYDLDAHPELAEGQTLEDEVINFLTGRSVLSATPNLYPHGSVPHASRALTLRRDAHPTITGEAPLAEGSQSGKTEADYIIVPIGAYGSTIRAAAAGQVSFVYDATKGGLCAIVNGDDGNRYVHIGLSTSEGESDRWVRAGEVVGKVGKIGGVTDIAALASIASAKKQSIARRVVYGYDLDRVLMGTCASFVFLVLGQPELATVTFIGALLYARLPKKEK